jgi:hypothetical protein
MQVSVRVEPPSITYSSFSASGNILIKADWTVIGIANKINDITNKSLADMEYI